MLTANFMKRQKTDTRCTDPTCENFDPADVVDGEDETADSEENDSLPKGNSGAEKVFLSKDKKGFMSQVDFATTRRPKKFLRPVDVSSLGRRKGGKK